MIPFLFLFFAAIEPDPNTPQICLPAIAPITLGGYMDSLSVFYCIPIQVIEGIAWNESHYGVSKLGRRSNNLFGIKCGDGWAGGRCGAYRAYVDRKESVQDFCRFITKHYPHLIGRPAREWVIRGYASKPYKF